MEEWVLLGFLMAVIIIGWRVVEFRRKRRVDRFVEAVGEERLWTSSTHTERG